MRSPQSCFRVHVFLLLLPSKLLTVTLLFIYYFLFLAAMVSIPVIYQQAGWLTCVHPSMSYIYLLMFMFILMFFFFCRTTLGMVIVMIIAAFSSTMMCKAMALVPGNERFQVCVLLLPA